MDNNRYTLLQRLLHWLVVPLVLGLLVVGATFWGLGYEGLVGLVGEDATNTLFMVHKSLGILVLLLMLVRLLLRASLRTPAYNPPLSGFERLLGGGIHVLLYLLLIALPIGGALATAASGYPVELFGLTLPALVAEDKKLGETLFTIHGMVSLGVAGLVLIHTAAALKHWRLKDGIMGRISLP